MWLFSTHGFVSIKQSTQHQGYMLARARKEEHLRDYFYDLSVIIEYTPGNDYSYQALVSREVFMESIMDRLDNPEFPGTAMDDPAFSEAAHAVYRVMGSIQAGPNPFTPPSEPNHAMIN
jgi:hypothetical protein